MPNQFLSPEGDLENYFITEYWLIDQYVGDTLWTWGNNGYGRLGDNTIISKSTPVTTFAGGANWNQVSVGGFHASTIKLDGTLWTWGYNANGNLGINNTIDRSTPVTTFAGGTNWKQIHSGGSYTAAIKTDGTLWVWGHNSNGQLGNNTTINRSTPVTTFAGGTNWKQVFGFTYHTAAIKTDGTLWLWGYNNAGQLGDNTVVQKLTPVTTFAGGTNWKTVNCGLRFTAAIKTDGTLWTWGDNGAGNGALGDNTGNQKSTPITTFAGGTNWKQVDCGIFHMSAVKTDGTLWTWGWNAYGTLGNNTTGFFSIITPVTTFAGGTNWKQVSCGYSHISAIKTDGTLWTWGRNNNSQLGDNTITNRCTPVTTFAGGTNWKQVSGGGAHTLAVTSGTDPTFFIS